jgi:hypothetical protein
LGRAAHNWGYVVPGHGNASTNRVLMPNNNITPPLDQPFLYP